MGFPARPGTQPPSPVRASHGEGKALAEIECLKVEVNKRFEELQRQLEQQAREGQEQLHKQFRKQFDFVQQQLQQQLVQSARQAQQLRKVQLTVLELHPPEMLVRAARRASVSAAGLAKANLDAMGENPDSPFSSPVSPDSPSSPASHPDPAAHTQSGLDVGGWGGAALDPSSYTAPTSSEAQFQALASPPTTPNTKMEARPGRKSAKAKPKVKVSKAEVTATAAAALKRRSSMLPLEDHPSPDALLQAIMDRDEAKTLAFLHLDYLPGLNDLDEKLPSPGQTDMGTKGQSVLHEAIRQSLHEVALVILKRKDFNQVNAKDPYGCTALHLVAARGKLEVCLAILTRPDFTEAQARCFCGTAIDVARLNRHPYAVMLLEGAG